MESFNFPCPKVKEEEPLDIIDLDTEKTAEDIVYEWDWKVRKKMKEIYIIDSDMGLDCLMKWYIKSFKEEVETFEDYRSLRSMMIKHMQYFKLCFLELNYCVVENYLENMEDILTFYLTVEMKLLPRKLYMSKRAYKKSLKSLCQKLLHFLNFNLLTREDHIHHVLIKTQFGSSQEIQDFWNFFLEDYLPKRPKNTADMDFCRVYILYQKWKTIRNKREWEKMDDVMYQLFKRSAETIKNNETLRQILLPLNSSLLDTLIHISENHVIISETYFNYIKRSDLQEDIINASYLDAIDLDDTDSPDLNNDEDKEFEAAYNEFVKIMANVSSTDLVDLTENIVKSEQQVVNDDDEDDCQIIGVTFGDSGNDKQEIYHEILDDDIEIIYYKKKSQIVGEKDTANVKHNTRKKKLSFLDSIQLPDTTNWIEETVSSTNSLPSTSTQICLLDDTTDTTSLNKGSQINTQSDEDEVYIISNVQSSTSVESINVVKSELNVETSTSKVATPCVDNSKCVTTTETQTENFSQVVDLDNCPCSKKKRLQNAERENVYKDYSYCYGLITPPSDQPSEDHTVSTTESISNVYANIVRTHNDPDMNSSNAVEEGLSSSMEEGDPESNVPENSVHSNESANFVASVIEQSPITTSIIEQNKYASIDDKSPSRSDDEFDNGCFDEEFEQDLEPNVLKKKGNTENTLDVEDVYANPCDSLNNNSEKIVNVESSEKPSSVYDSYDHDSNFVSDSCVVEGIAEQPPSSPSPSTNVNIKSTALPYLSPDVTSTFVNIQDCDERSPIQEEHVDEQQTTYGNLNGNISESEDRYLNVSSSEEFLVYSSYDSNDQTKRPEHNQQGELNDGEENEGEIFNKDPVLMNNNADELSVKQQHLIEEDVNITKEKPFDESSNHSDCSSTTVNNADDNEIEEPPLTTLEVNKADHSNPQKLNKEFKRLKEIVEKSDINKHDDGVLKKQRNSNKEKLVQDQSQKVIFTAPEKLIRSPKDDLSTFRETNLKWQRLEEQHSFEEFTNPISKINGTNYCVNPDPNFDLFSSKISTNSTERLTHTPTTNSSANSSIDVISPAYEEIDDFEPYMKSFNAPISPIIQDKVVSPKSKAKKSASLERSSVNKSEMLAKVFRKNIKSVPSHEDNVHKNSNSVSTNGNDETKHHVNSHSNVKKMRFADDTIDTCNTVVHSPVENSNVLHGILKKTSSSVTYNQHNTKKQSKHSQNKPCLGHYDVKSNTIIPDSKLQIHLNNLSESKISQLLNANKTAQKVRQKKQQAQNSMQEMLRVVYDKQTSHITENDVVHYTTTKSRQDEGLNSRDLPYTEKKNGKRKRQNSLNFLHQHIQKKNPVFRKAMDLNLENSSIRKTTRKRKKPEKDYDTLIKGGYSTRPLCQ